MAKIVGPLFSSEARGRMGGVVYGTHRGKSVAKAFKSPSNVKSAAQLNARAILARLSRYWASLTQEERDTWNAYALVHTLTDWTGQAKRLTGANWFVALSSILAQHLIAAVHSAPTVVAPDAPEAFVAITGVGEVTLNWDAGGPASSIVEIRAFGSHSPGKLGTLIGSKVVAWIDGELGTANVTLDPIGTYTFFARRISTIDGLPSPWVSAFTQVTA